MVGFVCLGGISFDILDFVFRPIEVALQEDAPGLLEVCCLFITR